MSTQISNSTAPGANKINLHQRYQRLRKLVKDERRRHRRFSMSRWLRLQPLNDNYEPIGEPGTVLSSDVSDYGIGMISMFQFSSGLAELTLYEDEDFLSPDPNCVFVVRIIRCKPIGPVWQLGAQMDHLWLTSCRSARSKSADWTPFGFLIDELTKQSETE